MVPTSELPPVTLRKHQSNPAYIKAAILNDDGPRTVGKPRPWNGHFRYKSGLRLIVVNGKTVDFMSI